MELRRPAHLFQGHISFLETDAGLTPIRLPADQIRLFPSADDNLVNRASKTSGVRLRFQTDASALVIHGSITKEMEEDSIKLDVTQGREIIGEAVADPTANELTIPLQGDPNIPYEIWFSTFTDVTVSSVTFEGAGYVEAPRDTRRRWLTYGSSITHCRGASSPARSWPATAARFHNLHLTNMGFGGQCHLDGMVAKAIRDQEFDVLTLKLGINVYGAPSLGPRAYLPAVINLVQTVRERHPAVPIGIISPIWSCTRETDANPLGLTLDDYREFNRTAVELLRDDGDMNIHYVDGRELLGEAEAHLLPDDLHPNGEGYVLMGERVARNVLPGLLDNA